MPGIARAIDGETGAVRSALAHGPEHAGQHLAELGLKGLILQKQTDNSAHTAPTTRLTMLLLATVTALCGVCQLWGILVYC
jgi:hypothetical protein